jgi:hypothetical protein
MKVYHDSGHIPLGPKHGYDKRNNGLEAHTSRVESKYMYCLVLHIVKHYYINSDNLVTSLQIL